MSALSGMISSDSSERLAKARGVKEPVLKERAWKTLLATGLLLAVGYGGALLLSWPLDQPEVPKIASGLNAFALLFILALAIERVIQPISPLLGPDSAVSKAERDVPNTKANEVAEAMVKAATDAAGAAGAVAVAKAKAVVDATAPAGADAVAKAVGDEVAKAAIDAASAAGAAGANAVANAVTERAAALGTVKKSEEEQKATVADDRSKTALVTWAAATGLASLAAVGLNITLLETVLDPSSARPPYWLDLLVTGLAVGAGTKPLNDLWTSLQAKS